jgi:hypothetical protein
MRHAIAGIAGTLLLTTTLVACGGDEPAVCGSVNDLQESVEGLKDVDLTSSNGVSDLESALTAVQDDLSSVESEAKSEFSAQLSAVDTAFASLQSSVADVQNDPSTDSLTAAGEALSEFGGAADTLIDDVQSTC